MLNVEQFRYDADNLSYVIYGSKQAVIIDGAMPARAETPPNGTRR